MHAHSFCRRLHDRHLGGVEELVVPLVALLAVHPDPCAEAHRRTLRDALEGAVAEPGVVGQHLVLAGFGELAQQHGAAVLAAPLEAPAADDSTEVQPLLPQRRQLGAVLLGHVGPLLGAEPVGAAAALLRGLEAVPGADHDAAAEGPHQRRAVYRAPEGAHRAVERAEGVAGRPLPQCLLDTVGVSRDDRRHALCFTTPAEKSAKIEVKKSLGKETQHAAAAAHHRVHT